MRRPAGWQPARQGATPSRNNGAPKNASGSCGLTPNRTLPGYDEETRALYAGGLAEDPGPVAEDTLAE